MKYLFTMVSIFMITTGLLTSCSEKHELHSEGIEYAVGDEKFQGYLAYDALLKGERPGILVVHEWWGINKHVRKRAEMLAQLGYTAFAIDMYGNGKQADNFDEAATLAREVSENPDVRRQRFMAALELLKGHETVDARHIAAIGYSFGGNVVLQMALDGVDIDGVISFHGGLLVTKPEEKDSVKARILILQGEKDWYVTPQMRTGFKADMKKSGVEYRIISYKDAEHGYTNPEADMLSDKFKGMHIRYNKETDEKSWTDATEFLKFIFEEL